MPIRHVPSPLVASSSLSQSPRMAPRSTPPVPILSEKPSVQPEWRPLIGQPPTQTTSSTPDVNVSDLLSQLTSAKESSEKDQVHTLIFSGAPRSRSGTGTVQVAAHDQLKSSSSAEKPSSHPMSLNLSNLALLSGQDSSPKTLELGSFQAAKPVPTAQLQAAPSTLTSQSSLPIHSSQPSQPSQSTQLSHFSQRSLLHASVPSDYESLSQITAPVQPNGVLPATMPTQPSSVPNPLNMLRQRSTPQPTFSVQPNMLQSTTTIPMHPSSVLQPPASVQPNLLRSMTPDQPSFYQAKPYRMGFFQLPAEGGAMSSPRSAR